MLKKCPYPLNKPRLHSALFKPIFIASVSRTPTHNFDSRIHFMTFLIDSYVRATIGQKGVGDDAKGE